MSKCKSCGKENANYIHYDGGKVCDKCVGDYFTCPDCGRVFEQDDYVNGDQGSGFCKDCSSDH